MSVAEAPGTKICDEARAYVDQVLHEKRIAIHVLLARCESPIEQQLAAALWARWDCRVRELGSGMDAPLGGDDCRVVSIEPQRMIVVANARYRADFVVYRSTKGQGVDPLIVVEADGREFHDRTQSQACRDRRRDRAMVLQGMRVLRFSGSEIYGDPDACAAEIDALLRSSR
ncbi:MAG: DUF559 domain-containing protein [bacterium]|nr:DUF559 domain-containing protein [bacterium]